MDQIYSSKKQQWYKLWTDDGKNIENHVGKYWKSEERVGESGVCRRCVLAISKELLPGGLEWRDISKSAVKGLINHECTWKIKRIKIRSDKSTNYFHGCGLMESTGTPQTEAQRNLKLDLANALMEAHREALRLQRGGERKTQLLSSLRVPSSPSANVRLECKKTQKQTKLKSSENLETEMNSIVCSISA